LRFWNFKDSTDQLQVLYTLAGKHYKFCSGGKTLAAAAPQAQPCTLHPGQSNSRLRLNSAAF
jgi:hypothetical protein